MRKLFVLLLTALLLGGAVFAQDDAEDVAEDVGEAIEDTADEVGDAAEEAADEVGDALEGDAMMSDFDTFGTTQWAGVGLGYPVTFYYGISDLLGDTTDVRFRASSYFFNVVLGADALFDITTLDDLPVDIYAGGGPTLGFGFAGRGFGIGVNGSVGGEYRLSEQLGLFAELGVGYVFYTGSAIVPLGGLAPGGSLGVNFHF